MIATLRDRARLRRQLKSWSRDPNMVVYGLLLLGALVFPPLAAFATGTSTLLGLVADAGVWILLAIGLNVVVGFAGLLDLGYAAFFAIGAYTYALLASAQLKASPLHMAVHLPFWLLLFVAMFVAAGAGALLGAPTLRLRGDYLAIVTLGFGEIVPRIFRNDPGGWTGGINAIGGIDQPNIPICLDGPWSAGDDLAIHGTDALVLDRRHVLLVQHAEAGLLGAAHRTRQPDGNVHQPEAQGACPDGCHAPHTSRARAFKVGPDRNGRTTAPNPR